MAKADTPFLTSADWVQGQSLPPKPEPMNFVMTRTLSFGTPSICASSWRLWGRSDMPETVPQNGGYLVAAYIVVAVILIGYALSLYLRARRSLRA